MDNEKEYLEMLEYCDSSLGNCENCKHRDICNEIRLQTEKISNSVGE